MDATMRPMDRDETQQAAGSPDWEERRAAAIRLGSEAGTGAKDLQRQLLRDDNLAVIEAMAEALVRSGDVASAALVCEALVTESDQVGDTLNMVLLPLWKSGAVDLPKLLVAVAEDHEGIAEQGAKEALQWLGAAHDAVEQGNIESLTSLLNIGVDVNDPTWDGCTLLHHAIDLEVDSAAQSGQPLTVELTRLLVERGADLDHRWHGQTPLEAALHRGHHLAVGVIRAARLSEAIVLWTGRGTEVSPHRDGARVVEHLGEEAAAELLPQVLNLYDDFYASKAYMTAPDLAAMGQQASEEFRQLHPEITTAAVEALVWCYTFDHK